MNLRIYCVRTINRGLTERELRSLLLSDILRNHYVGVFDKGSLCVSDELKKRFTEKKFEVNPIHNTNKDLQRNHLQETLTSVLFSFALGNFFRSPYKCVLSKN